MTDVRSLLRTHQQSSSSSSPSTRISHPLASYTSTGTLRCIACSIAVPPRGWEGHIISKQHRKRAAAIRLEGDGERKVKRKDGREEVAEERRGEKRRRVSEAPEEGDVDMDDEASPKTNGGGLPAGFFSDPSRSMPTRESTPSDTEEPEPPAAASAAATSSAPTASAPIPAAPAPNRALNLPSISISAPPPPPPPTTSTAAAPSTVDEEFDAFLRDLSNPTPVPSSDDLPTPAALIPGVKPDAFARATVFADPVLAEPELPAGFPASLAPPPSTPATSSALASTALANGATPAHRPPGTAQTPSGETPQAEQETEEARRMRKEREEKELILDRILDEERAQEEADERVLSLRGRVEAVKRLRRERMGKSKGV